MADKFGPYITKLMATVLDFKEDMFVRGLAIEELRRLNIKISDFIKPSEHVDFQILRADREEPYVVMRIKDYAKFIIMEQYVDDINKA